LIQISADTLRDEVRRDGTCTGCLVRTERSELMTPGREALPIIPGMLAQVDIETGQKIGTFVPVQAHIACP